MANNVNIIYSTAGLGTPAVGQDFISGMIFYNSVYPSGFSATGNTQQIYSVAQAATLGITDTSIGETRASGTITITATGSVGSQITAQVNTTVFGLVTLGSYTVISTDTPSTVATGLAVAINANTISNGFSATSSTSGVTVSAPQQTGVGGTAFVFNNIIVGTLTATAGAFSGGVASTIDPLYYHVEEFFRGNPTGVLWCMITTGTSSSSAYSEITTLQNASSGIIRQIGIYEQVAFASANLSYMQTQVNTLTANNTPLEVIYQGDFSSVSNLSSLTDLSTLTCPNVTVTFGQDAGNTAIGGGYRIWLATGKSIGTMGITLGAISSALVSWNIGWVAQFNVDAVELDTLAYANGALLSAQAINLNNQIDAKQYCFVKKYVGISGSYFNNDYVSVSPTFVYNSIHLNRTIHKVARNVRAALLPSLAGPIQLNSDGTIALTTILFYDSEAQTALAAMKSAGEISQYATIINAKQNVLATSTLNMTVQVVPIGSANTIDVNLGFVLAV
jgi:hypothetical protein